MHLAIRKYKYQLLAQPYRFFEKIWEYLLQTGHGSLVTIHHEDQVISGAIHFGSIFSFTSSGA